MTIEFRILLIGVFLLFSAGPLAAQQEWSFEGSELLVSNLVGTVTVRGHDGPRIVVRATPGGRDAETINFEVRRDGAAEFHAVFPLDRSLDYVYPELRGHTEINVHSWRDDSSFLEELYSMLSRRDRIEIDDGGGGLEAWVDLEVLVPRDIPTSIRLGAGRLEARGVEGDLDLDSHRGPVTAEGIRGDTRIDTGSGAVRASDIRGSLNVDTGSGHVDLRDVEGQTVWIDTGSGGVEAEGVRTSRLEIDTGSGRVRTSRVQADDSNIDTGSGSVTLDLLRLDRGRHVIDTGSGRVTVRMPADASVRIHAETGSGSIELDLPAARLRRMSRDELELELGDGAASLDIDTGSGGVRLQTRGG